MRSTRSRIVASTTWPRYWAVRAFVCALQKAPRACSSPVILRPASAFVEFYAEQTEREPWLSLWLVFDVSPETSASDRCSGNAACDDRLRRLYLVELQAEYWGI